jgi:hypothetical protein
VLLCGACGGDAGLSRIYGEVHVHSFSGGSHPGALFLATGAPAASVEGDSILPAAPPVASDGACTFSDGSCAGCVTPPPPVDAGPVHIRGGAGIADVELTFSAQQRTYLAVAAIDRSIFDGGETLALDGDGAAAAAFHGTLIAPAPLQLTEPRNPGLGSGDLEIAWIPGTASRVLISLVASTTDDRWSMVECTGDDSLGRVTVPASLLARFPAPPRDLQLGASRDQLTFAHSARAGDGVVLHAGFAVQVSWHEAAP